MEQTVKHRPRFWGFGEYLLEYRGLWGLLLVFTAIFAAVFYGYRLPMEAVLYGSLLCVCAALLLLAWRYRGFQKKMAALSRMEETFLQDPDRYLSLIHI